MHAVTLLAGVTKVVVKLDAILFESLPVYMKAQLEELLFVFVGFELSYKPGMIQTKSRQYNYRLSVYIYSITIKSFI